MRFEKKFSTDIEHNVIKHLRDCPSKTAILSDIDGTLHPIVERPDQIHFTDYIPSILEKLARKYAIVGLITGRSLKNALHFIKARGIIYIGNHGLEISRNSKIEYARGVQEFIPGIRRALDLINNGPLGKIPGIFIEDKKVAVAVHYRQAPDRSSVVGQFVSQTAKELGLKVIRGRKVYELQPPVKVNKGTALVEILKASGVNLALYMGDDISDIKAFRRLKAVAWHDFNAITVGVRSKEVKRLESEESVDYLIDSIDDAVALLHSLV